jgi:hypothetical protein
VSGHFALLQGWPDFFAHGPNSKIKNSTGRTPKFLLIFRPKIYLFKVFSNKMVSKSSLQRPQKMFGGPQFGHVALVFPIGELTFGSPKLVLK